jgi:hypothetical protein
VSLKLSVVISTLLMLGLLSGKQSGYFNADGRDTHGP